MTSNNNLTMLGKNYILLAKEKVRLHNMKTSLKVVPGTSIQPLDKILPPWLANTCNSAMVIIGPHSTDPISGRKKKGEKVRGSGR